MQLIRQFLFVIFLALCLTANNVSYGQIGGLYAFESAGLPPNARVSALGGSLISVSDDDVSLAQINPAVLDSLMSGQLAINHNFHFAGSSFGNAAFGKHFKDKGITGHIALQFVDYGSFDLTDERGNIEGEFSAGEFGILAGVSKQLNERIRGGVNIKALFSNYESYGSFAIGADLGILYTVPGSNTRWGIVLRNIGTELDPVVETKRSLPADLQIGVSKRLKHLPFRFSIIAHHMQKWHVRYDDPDADSQSDIFGNVSNKSAFGKTVDNVFRHLIFNGEFLIGNAEQFRLRFGYNHLRKQELKVQTFRSLAGFSVGVGFSIKKIKIDYGLGYYHISGANNHLSLRLDMNRLFDKI